MTQMLKWLLAQREHYIYRCYHVSLLIKEGYQIFLGTVYCTVILILYNIYNNGSYYVHIYRWDKQSMGYVINDYYEKPLDFFQELFSVPFTINYLICVVWLHELCNMMFRSLNN